MRVRCKTLTHSLPSFPACSRAQVRWLSFLQSTGAQLQSAGSTLISGVMDLTTKIDDTVDTFFYSIGVSGEDGVGGGGAAGDAAVMPPPKATHAQAAGSARKQSADAEFWNMNFGDVFEVRSIHN